MRFDARWILPVGASPIRDGSVIIEADRIAWIGPRANAPFDTPKEDLGDAIITPGLVNAHIHLDLAAFAGVPLPRAFFAWIRALMRRLDAVGTDELKTDSASWSVADQLAHGVTTIAHTGPGRESFDAMRHLGARGIAYAEVFGPHPDQCAAAIASLRASVDAMRPDETSLVRVGVSPHAPYTVSDQLFARVAQYATAESLPVAVHIAESDDESEYVTRGQGAFADFLRGRGIPVAPRAVSPIALLETHGVLATKPLCIHAVHVDAADIARMASSGASVAHCPHSNAWFAHGASPVRALRTAGVAVGVGTDSAASNDAVRVLAEARDAADATLSNAQRLELVTREGARALGLGGETGTLDVGRQADIAAFAVRDVAECDRDPVGFLLENCADSPALVTLVAGVVCARNGVALQLDSGVGERMVLHRSRVRDWVDGLA